jgi:uncharacterized protein YqeY
MEASMEKTLRQRLEEDLKTALKESNQVAKDTIRFTLSALKYAEVEKRAPLSDAESITLLQREAKRRADSIDQFRSANRPDLVEREEQQLEVLNRYLPQPLSEEELNELVAAVIQETGAAGPKDMGKAMPLLVERAGGRADGKRLSTALRTALPK